MIYEKMKVFNCQNMPNKVKEAFFKASEDTGNDCYIKWYIKGNSDRSEYQILVDDWLIANGAEDAPDEETSGEEVLIQHWW